MSFRFAILRHRMPAESGWNSHWDLLLQQPFGFGEALLTFAAPTPPEVWGHTTVVQQLPDHRPLYLDYEGPVSNNRGSVSRVRHGTIQWQEFSEHSLILALQFERMPADSNRVFAEQRELKIRKLTDQPGDAQWELELKTTGVENSTSAP